MSEISAFAPQVPTLFGIPLDFVLFGLTLLGVAVFHHHTLRVALAGLVTISIYKIAFTGFKTGPGLIGFVSHVGHEWVILANLLCLLMGFALLSRHFEKSHVPVALPKYLPHDWKGGFILLVMVWVLSSFLDNIAAALIGGAMANQLFRAKVHIGYLAAIVAASNAGGAWSVIGDTTTTMMWIAGVSPVQVFHAIIASSVALLVFGIPAAIKQQRHSPILGHVHEYPRVDWMRIGIVGLILGLALATNVIVNVKFTGQGEHFPFIGVAVWVAIAFLRGNAPARLGTTPESLPRLDLSAFTGVNCLDDAGGKIAPGILENDAGPGFSIRRVRQYSAHGARTRAGRLRLGHARLCGGVRWLDDLVRVVRGCCNCQYLPGSAFCESMDQRWMVYRRRICSGLHRDVDGARLAPAGSQAQGRPGPARRRRPHRCSMLRLCPCQSLKGQIVTSGFNDSTI